MTVYEELLSAAESVDFAPKGRNESTPVYLVRLARAIYTVERSLWDHLSQPAQQWYVEAARRINARLTIDTCPGYDERSVIGIDAGAQKGAPKTQPVVSDNAGLTEAVRKAVLLNPDESREGIIGYLSEQGWPIDHLRKNQTVTVVRSVTLATIKAAKQLGLWKEQAA